MAYRIEAIPMTLSDLQCHIQNIRKCVFVCYFFSLFLFKLFSIVFVYI